MRRTAGVVWLAALSAALLAAACGGDADDQPTPQAQQQTATVAVVEQAEPAEQPQRAAAVQSGDGQQDRQEQSTAGASSEPGQQTRQQAEQHQNAPIIAPQPFDAAYALELLRAIAEEIGPRSNGQPGEQRTVEFLTETLRGDGYEVAIEPFEFSSGLPQYVVTVASSDGGSTPTASIPVTLMQGSPERPASGPLVIVPGYGTEEDFASVEAAGAIAVVARGELRFIRKQRNAEAAGAVALLVYDTVGPFRGTLLDSVPGEIPVAELTPDTAQMVFRHKGATATLSPNESADAELSESWNVVAQRRGGECRVLVGGHYDSVPQVQGANDNASGIGTMLALARAWSGASSADDVCFVGFGAEELGLHGSHAFVDAALELGEFEKITAMLNLDAIGNGQRPIIAAGDAALAALLERLGEQLEIDVRSGQEPEGIRSDHTAFRNKGLPVLFPVVTGGILHVPSDTTENIDEALLRDMGLLAHAMLECLLEQAGAPIEPRLSCDAEGQ